MQGRDGTEQPCCGHRGLNGFCAEATDFPLCWSLCGPPAVLMWMPIATAGLSPLSVAPRRQTCGLPCRSYELANCGLPCSSVWFCLHLTSHKSCLECAMPCWQAVGIPFGRQDVGKGSSGSPEISIWSKSPSERRWMPAGDPAARRWGARCGGQSPAWSSAAAAPAPAQLDHSWGNELWHKSPREALLGTQAGISLRLLYGWIWGCRCPSISLCFTSSTEILQQQHGWSIFGAAIKI